MTSAQRIAAIKIEHLKRGIPYRAIPVLLSETGCTQAEEDAPPPPRLRQKPNVVYDPPWWVYALRDPRTHAIRYVGITTHLKQRFASHRRPDGTTPKDEWVRELKAAGFSPKLEILQKGKGGDGGRQAEERWIRKMRLAGAPLTNATQAIAQAGASMEKLNACLAVQRDLRRNWRERVAQRPVFDLEYWTGVIREIWHGKRIWTSALDAKARKP